MKNFTGLVLCDYRSERVDVHVWADYVDGKLVFSGQDLEPFVEEFFGDTDYEYWYSLEKEEADKLIDVIHGQTDLQSALLREFSGEKGCAALRKVCEKNGIRYGFVSYV